MNDWHQPWTGAARKDPHGFEGLEGLDGDAEAWSTPAPEPGSPLPPFRPSPSLQRTRFAIDLPDASTAAVDVDHMAGRASLYRDGRHVQTSDMPVRFPLGSDGIEVAASRYGMQRIHLISADGSRRRLDPAPGTPEHWRARLSRRHPEVGRALAACAVLVLTVNLILLAPQLLGAATHLPIWADRFTPFVSPIDLPAWANTILTVTTGLAGTERALTFRHHRLLDAEAEGLGG
ncbi:MULTISPECIES: hypothetical protein [Nocardiopsidaceae]|uniref:PEGA domain-containing protein n=1 Tax=Streptomonospora nanhaiensis TaxID=1323731 RepID=A0ABY6YFI5_9ACTN|nr:hypothetical protein [Streptomonospora nanhaiensis]WAE71017.1 hypothetical protein OUQ99_17425 [Streptomonospora nanhaiensis]